MKKNLIVSVKEARNILGEDAIGMTDDEIINVIETLDILASDALDTARHRLRIQKDAKGLANLIYDIYQDKKRHEKSQQ